MRGTGQLRQGVAGQGGGRVQPARGAPAAGSHPPAGGAPCCRPAADPSAGAGHGQAQHAGRGLRLGAGHGVQMVGKKPGSSARQQLAGATGRAISDEPPRQRHTVRDAEIADTPPSMIE